MTGFNEDTLRITRYEPLAELPDPFILQDGSAVQSAADWQRRRGELFDLAVTLQYGAMPPAPEFVDVAPLYLPGPGGANFYRITSGTRANPVSFTMTLYLPAADRPPVAISGDLCFGYAANPDYIAALLDNGVALAMFNRTELAPDLATDPPRQGPLYAAYPDATFSALGAWAWGYSRCVDALERLELVDMDCVAFTGHSRGGKTAMLAGVLDERAAIVNPNESGAGGCGCYKLHISAVDEFGVESRNEQLSDLIRVFPFWMGPGMAAYADREAELPFDEHYLKALIAPRVLYLSDAVSDVWANPVGAWQTTRAAEEVYKFLGCGDSLLWSFRSGRHAQTPGDMLQLVNVIRHVRSGEPLNEHFFRAPFKAPEPMFSWRCPE